MLKLWTDRAWEDYLYWQTQDRKTLRRVNELIRDIERNPYNGTGQPEALRGNLSGQWSRRIDKFNRLVYRIQDEAVVIIQCRGHYGD